MPIMMVNGTNLHYEQRGEGYPLVMIMGLSANRSIGGQMNWSMP